MNLGDNEVDGKVRELLDLIEKEKQSPKPDKKQMRRWFAEIVRLKEDWRTTSTGQDNMFWVHTSMRTWRDDC